jgi:hypothetical protein
MRTVIQILKIHEPRSEGQVAIGTGVFGEMKQRGKFV